MKTYIFTEKLVKNIQRAFNMIPNKQGVGTKGESSYNIASSIDYELANQRANGYMVAYCLVKRDSYGNDLKYKSDYMVFVDPSDLLSVEEQANAHYDMVVAKDDWDNGWELYSANICEIKKSTEAHYTNI